jgi:hypothetical protein
VKVGDPKSPSEVELEITELFIEVILPPLHREKIIESPRWTFIDALMKGEQLNVRTFEITVIENAAVADPEAFVAVIA